MQVALEHQAEARFDGRKTPRRVGGRKRQMTDNKVHAAKKLLVAGTPPRRGSTNLGSVDLPYIAGWQPRVAFKVGQAHWQIVNILKARAYGVNLSKPLFTLLPFLCYELDKKSENPSHAAVRAIERAADRRGGFGRGRAAERA